MEETLNPSNPSTSGMDPKSEGTNLTLNKLIAGDFLQTLGQELGLQVLPNTQPPPFSSRKPPKLGDSGKRSEEKPTVSKKERGKISRDRSDPEIPADSNPKKERGKISSCSHNSCCGNGVCSKKQDQIAVLRIGCGYREVCELMSSSGPMLGSPKRTSTTSDSS